MLLKVAFVRIVLLVRFRNLVFHPDSLFFMLSKMNWKSTFTGLLWKIGKPRYLPKCVSNSNAKGDGAILAHLVRAVPQEDDFGFLVVDSNVNITNTLYLTLFLYTTK